MKGIRVLFAVLLSMAGILPSHVHAQTLAEVLNAIQKRNKLVQERYNIAVDLNNSPDGAGWEEMESEPIKLIEWSGTTPEPSESQINGLSVDNKLKLIEQAWGEISKLAPRFLDSRQVTSGVGFLNALDFGRSRCEVNVSNYQYYIKILARRVSCLRTLSWPGLWKYKLDQYNEQEEGSTSYPPPPIQMQGGMNVPDAGYETATMGGFGFSGHLYPAPSEDPHDYLDPSPPTYTQKYWYYDETQTFEIKSKASSYGVGGKFQVYTNFGYVANRFDGLTWSASFSGGDGTSETLKHPINQKCVENQVGPADAVDIASSNLLDVSSLSFPGGWNMYDANRPGLYPPGYLEIANFVPTYSNQNNSGLWTSCYDPTITLDSDKPGVLGPLQAYMNGADIGYSPLAESWTNYRWEEMFGVFSEGSYNGLGGVLAFATIYTIDFGSEFSNVMTASISIPEELPALNIFPDFTNNQIKVPLAKLPANECNLIWKFPSRIQTPDGDLKNSFGAISARYVIQAQGSGSWDAIYSGRPGDREPEYQWIGKWLDKNKRWPTFESYIREYWQPVLKQLVCATYGVNITQQGRYKYKIDFYRRQQVGAKNPTTGEYDFASAGTPIDTFVVENPEADDAKSGALRITIHKGASNEAIYDITLVQALDNNWQPEVSTWNLTAKQSGVEFLKQNSIVTSPTASGYPVIVFTRPLTVVDTKSVNGVALPKVTTTYWVWPPGYAQPGSIDDPIDKVVEEVAGGTRTTTYTYDWEDRESSDGSSSKYRVIDHLQTITQTGGPNPYSEDYDSADQITMHQDTHGTTDMSYAGQTVTRVEKINGQAARTLVTTYSGDLSGATTKAQ